MDIIAVFSVNEFNPWKQSVFFKYFAINIFSIYLDLFPSKWGRFVTFVGYYTCYQELCLLKKNHVIWPHGTMASPVHVTML